MVRDRNRSLRARMLSALACALALGAAGGEAARAGTLDRSAAQIRDYWTPERMRNAIPIRPLTGETAAAKRGTIAKPVRHPARRGNRTHGKVFLTLNGVDYACSATSVRSPSRSLVWTAGHCVFAPLPLNGGGSYASNWEFVPAYRRGRSPYGEWPAQKLQAPAQWRNFGGMCVPGGLRTVCGDLRYDLGAARVAPRDGGRKLQQIVGARGIVFNGPRDLAYDAFGYPAAGQFNGRRMWRCGSDYKGADHGISGSPKPMRLRCDMTGGSSGGGWVAGGKVRSVISYGDEFDPNSLYGPYQGDVAEDLYASIKNG